MPVVVAITLGILGSNSIRKLLTVNLIKYKILLMTFATSFRFTVLTLYVVFSFYRIFFIFWSLHRKHGH